MENKQITLVSMVDGRVGINVPDLRLKRLWEQKGSKKKVAFDVLQEAFYDPSVEYLIRQGMLYVDDKEARIALGLEENEEGAQPIQMLKDEEINRLLTVVPTFEFRQKMKELTKEQIKSIVDYAVKHEITAYDKCEILKEYSEVDIIKTVQFNNEEKGE